LTAKSTADSGFLAAKTSFFRRHSVGKGYNNDCVLEGEAFSGEIWCGKDEDKSG